MPEGELRVDAFVELVGPAKVGPPMITEGVSPIEKGGENIVTTLKTFVTHTFPDLSIAIPTEPGTADLFCR